MGALDITRLIVYIILYPIVKLLSWLLIALTPLVHSLRLLFAGLRIPLRILASLEPVWIYLGTAVVVGVVAGAILHLTSSALITLFHLRSEPENKVKLAPQRTDINQLRRGRGRRPMNTRVTADMTRSRLGTPLINPYVEPDHLRGRPKRGLLAQTILEEEDDSDRVS